MVIWPYRMQSVRMYLIYWFVLVYHGLFKRPLSMLVDTSMSSLKVRIQSLWCCLRRLLKENILMLLWCCIGLTYSTVSLLSTVVFLLMSVHLNGWKLDKRLGILLMVWYFLFIALASMYELNVFGNFNPPQCPSK